MVRFPNYLNEINDDKLYVLFRVTFIIQRHPMKHVSGCLSYLHSLDELRLAKACGMVEIRKRASTMGRNKSKIQYTICVYTSMQEQYFYLGFALITRYSRCDCYFYNSRCCKPTCMYTSAHTLINVPTYRASVPITVYETYDVFVSYRFVQINTLSYGDDDVCLL